DPNHLSTGTTTIALTYNNRVTERWPAQVSGGSISNAMIPDWVSYTLGSGKIVNQPAWKLTVNGTPYWFIAGDADGDGVADSGLRKLPVGEVSGLTFFYACRIIDNGSAINVNTAWSRDHEFRGNDAGSFAFYGAGGSAASNIPQATNLFTSNIAL